MSEPLEMNVDFETSDTEMNLEADMNCNIEVPLPIASATQLGGIKVGENLSIAPDGTLSAEASPVVVDDTLTIAGAAADAKKTGDEISGLKEDLNNNVSDLKSAFNTLDETVTSITGRDATVTGNLIVVSDQLGHSAKITAQSAEVLHTGKNILAYPYANTRPSSSQNGITWVQNDDEIVTANGTATANSVFEFVAQASAGRRPIKAGTYTFSGCPSGGGDSTYRMIVGITGVGDVPDDGDGVTVNIQSDTTYYMYFRVYSGQTVTNLEIKPQIEVGSLKTAREKYVSNSYTVNGTENITLYEGVNTFISNNSINVEYAVEKNELISDVKDYGAVGDGVTDDTVALQTAINDCENRILILSEGTYLFSSTLQINEQITIKGCGKQSVLKLANTVALDAIDWRTNDAASNSKFKYPFICIDADNCVLENFTLEGQTSAFKDENEDGITVQGKNHILSNLTVFNINYFKDSFTSRTCLCPAWGINIFNASNVLVTNCHVYDCGYECIGTESAENIVIDKCTFIDANQTSAQVHRLSNHIKFINNFVYHTENIRSQDSPALTMDAPVDNDMNDILIEGNTLLARVNTVGGRENNVSILNNTIVGTIAANQYTVYPTGLMIGCNRIEGRINVCSDNAYVFNNVINNASVGNYMIQIYGNKSAQTCNHGIGAGTATNIVTHE